ncbi:hypothetical protein PtB15_10B177 [Puccinia triticina]|nr:hypothetical protein PtB15_10B177 [Puccinia triticina]
MFLRCPLTLFLPPSAPLIPDAPLNLTAAASTGFNLRHATNYRQPGFNCRQLTSHANCPLTPSLAHTLHFFPQTSTLLHNLTQPNMHQTSPSFVGLATTQQQVSAMEICVQLPYPAASQD